MISILGLFALSVTQTGAVAYAAEAEVTWPAVSSAKGFEVIILSSYKETLKIGQEFMIVAMSTGGSEITWKSDNSRVASVDRYGVVTAKKAGTAKIKAKTSGAESSCIITVEKTKITLNKKRVWLENGSTFKLEASTSNGSVPTFKSSKQSVAIVSDEGLIQTVKPGTSTITVSADGSKETFTVNVMKPAVKLSAATLTMSKGQTAVLTAKVSSKKDVTWSSSKPSVATITEYGKVTAIKHGETRISAKVDGVTRYCTVRVKSPTIKLNKSSVNLKKGKSFALKATVSSGATPTYHCSSKKVATVSSDGVIHAKSKGSCTITVKEDGTTAKCKVKVTD